MPKRLRQPQAAARTGPGAGFGSHDAEKRGKVDRKRGSRSGNAPLRSAGRAKPEPGGGVAPAYQNCRFLAAACVALHSRTITNALEKV